MCLFCRRDTLADGVSLPEISVLIGSAMMMRTLSGESPISIGGINVDSDDWYAITDGSGTVSTEGADADNWNVYVTKDDTTVTVTLKDATIANNSSAHAIEVSGCDLEIELEGTSNRIGTGTASSNGYAVYNSTGGKNISITGPGDLIIAGSYGVYINGLGDVTIDIEGGLTVQSTWQMIRNTGNFVAAAESITMDGYYIQSAEGDTILTARGGDVTVRGTGDYGIQSGGDITISAPNGRVTVSGGTYSLYQDQFSSAGDLISISAKNSIS